MQCFIVFPKEFFAFFCYCLSGSPNLDRDEGVIKASPPDQVVCAWAPALEAREFGGQGIMWSAFLALTTSASLALTLCHELIE